MLGKGNTPNFPGAEVAGIGADLGTNLGTLSTYLNIVFAAVPNIFSIAPIRFVVGPNWWCIFCERYLSGCRWIDSLC